MSLIAPKLNDSGNGKACYFFFRKTKHEIITSESVKEMKEGACTAIRTLPDEIILKTKFKIILLSKTPIYYMHIFLIRFLSLRQLLFLYGLSQIKLPKPSLRSRKCYTLVLPYY